MSQRTEPLPVVFRVWLRENIVFALFPTEPADDYGAICVAFDHNGKCFSLDYKFAIRKSRPASKGEYEALKQRLEARFKLHRIYSAQQAHHAKRRENAKL